MTGVAQSSARAARDQVPLAELRQLSDQARELIVRSIHTAGAGHEPARPGAGDHP